MVQALLKNHLPVTYAEIDAPHGHDAFLLDDRRYHAVMQGYYDQIARELNLGERAETLGVLA
jgi:homoserine O-acetyltransferase